MCTILCRLLLWQMCAPLCMPHPIGPPYFTSSLRWQTCASLFMPRPIGLPYFTLSLLWQTCMPLCSACPVRSVCRISLRRSSDRHAHPSAYSIRLVVCHIPLCQSSDRHARPSACPIRSDCRISLRRSSDWHLRHSRLLAADLRLSLSHETLTLPLLLPYKLLLL